MTSARRQLVQWLLTAALERGLDPLRAMARPHEQPPARARVLSRSERAALSRWPGRVYYLASRRA